jgi:hypothetical protein
MGREEEWATQLHTKSGFASIIRAILVPSSARCVGPEMRISPGRWFCSALQPAARRPVVLTHKGLPRGQFGINQLFFEIR